MRARPYILLALLLWPCVASAAPSVEQIIKESIKALQGRSYEARMKFISHLEGGQTREVQVFHVAPDLYRVELQQAGQPSGEYFIENASELLLLSPGKAPVMMPQRQFAINDAMTVKFMRDLGGHPGVSVLDGEVSKQAVYVLRKGVTPSQPYEVTVGVDRKTYFPLFLLVNDASGAARVYYEMQSLQYRSPDKLPDALFTVDSLAADSAERLPQMPASGRALLGELQAAKPGKSAQMSAEPLPLYPSWLPHNYRLEAVSLLRCPKGMAKGDCALVYQLEAYGPGLDDLISIFQMHAADSQAEKSIQRLKAGQDTPFYLTTMGDWVVAVFGDLSQNDLKQIAQSLASDPDDMRALLRLTEQRDGIMEEAFSSAR